MKTLIYLNFNGKIGVTQIDIVIILNIMFQLVTVQ
mgnify:CR=1 FL=1